MLFFFVWGTEGTQKWDGDSTDSVGTIRKDGIAKGKMGLEKMGSGRWDCDIICRRHYLWNGKQDTTRG